MTTQTLSIGKSITSAQETLEINNLSEIFQRVTGVIPSTLEHDTSRLRKLMSLDKVGYRAAKTRLPYVVGSVFHEGVRRIDSLAAAHYFILDVDHIQLEDGRIPDLILSEPSVSLAFVSPGGEGVKIFCSLSSPCTDPKLFSVAYKVFASEFADRVGLSGSMDLRTSDASRACFLSFDPNAFYNPNAIQVDWRTLGEAQVEQQYDTDQLTVTNTDGAKSTSGIDQMAYKNILKAINPNTPIRREKNVFVPEQLLRLRDELGALCKTVNLELTKIDPINYGLKVGAGQGYRAAEVNIFYGKKGFSVIVSPRTGTDPVLNELLHGCIHQYLFPPVQTVDIPLLEYFSTN